MGNNMYRFEYFYLIFIVLPFFQYIKIQSTPNNHSVIQFFSSIWVVNKTGLDIDIERRVMGLHRQHEHSTPTRCKGDGTTPTILTFKSGKVSSICSRFAFSYWYCKYTIAYTY